MRKITVLAFAFVMLFTACTIPSSVAVAIIEALADPIPTNWTVMYYVDADNDLEGSLLEDIQELRDGIPKADIVNVIALVDRTDQPNDPLNPYDTYTTDSTILGENFADTRLYRVDSDEIERLDGGAQFSDIPSFGESVEYNMGNAETLKKFIEYCKENYPAAYYALIFTNHGGGVRSAQPDSPVSRSVIDSSDLLFAELASKGVCSDETDGDDILYTAEITDVLDDSHAVDLFVIDACLMGMLEVGYQYRPGVTGKFSTDYLVASTPVVWGAGYPYDRVFYRLRSPVTAETFGRYFVEEQKKDTSRSDQALSLYDLDYANNVLSALDAVAKDLDDDDIALGSIAVDDTLDIIRAECIAYFNESEDIQMITIPQYDLYDFAESTVGSVTPSLRSDLRIAIENMVVTSFGNSAYSGFEAGKNGLGFFFPDGNADYSGTPHWAYQWWYTGIDTESSYGAGKLYGKLEACHSNTNGIVEGWYELLEETYDPFHTYTNPAW